MHQTSEPDGSRPQGPKKMPDREEGYSPLRNPELPIYKPGHLEDGPHNDSGIVWEDDEPEDNPGDGRTARRRTPAGGRSRMRGGIERNLSRSGPRLLPEISDFDRREESTCGTHQFVCFKRLSWIQNIVMNGEF